MSKEINIENASLYILDYIESINPEGAYEESRKHSALFYIQYILNWHVEPAQNDSKRNTEHHEQK